MIPKYKVHDVCRYVDREFSNSNTKYKVIEVNINTNNYRVKHLEDAGGSYISVSIDAFDSYTMLDSLYMKKIAFDQELGRLLKETK